MLTRGVCAAAAATLLLPAVHGQAATGVKGEEPSVDIHTTQISAQALGDRHQYETYEVRLFIVALGLSAPRALAGPRQEQLSQRALASPAEADHG